MTKVCYLIFISFVLALANGQRDLPSCSSFVSNSSCYQIIYSMIDCVSFLSAGSAISKASASCCSGFKSVLKADADCMCQAIREATQMGMKLNMTRVAELPSDCGVSHFSVLKICDVSDSPAASPAKSPKPSPKKPVAVPMNAPTPSPLPPTKSSNPSPPRTKIAPASKLHSPPQTKTAPAPKPPATRTPVPSPKSSKSPAPSSIGPPGGGPSEVPAPAPTNLNSGSYHLNSCVPVVFSFCMIYLSFVVMF
ncbi:hypothetical protein BT93_F1862 [Corymbia citriodora subsp. variegata]|nr:hypothetical protein BT93_F1862 [Corymbia citriodora subsp. variegata]